MSLGLSLIIPCAKLAADGDFDWFKDDFNPASFKGTAVLADGNTAPSRPPVGTVRLPA